jgi:hypothetical protein
VIRATRTIGIVSHFDISAKAPFWVIFVSSTLDNPMIMIYCKTRTGVAGRHDGNGRIVGELRWMVGMSRNFGK